MENGRRADSFGSNPHSNGDIFSRFVMVFLEIIEHTVMIITEIAIAIRVDNIILNITFSFFKIF